MKTKKDYIKPIHPGEILRDEFLEPMKISQYRLAKETGVSAIRISQIVNGKRAISADTALRLATFFGTSEQFWMNLQSMYDMTCTKQKYGEKIKKEVHPWSASKWAHAS
ncbi:MAG: family transcriptional regulator [Gammaproteobacteria bacterium]|jgi:addiction module HigA family antidote|nr:family transcriptional regulator [Gammaproteobacteria bacterium]